MGSGLGQARFSFLPVPAGSRRWPDADGWIPRPPDRGSRSARVAESKRGDGIDVARRVYLDWLDWAQQSESIPHLNIISQALWQDRKLELTLRFSFETEVFRRVSPLGLVAKGGAWFLVNETSSEIRVYPVSNIKAVRLCDEGFERPPDFDLGEFWKNWREIYRKNRASFHVMARIAPDLLPILPGVFGESIRAAIAGAPPADEHGWIIISLPFENFEQARERVLGFGCSIEVLDPLALRHSVIDFASQTLGMYQ